jgi:hypothetical protein
MSLIELFAARPGPCLVAIVVVLAFLGSLFGQGD